MLLVHASHHLQQPLLNCSALCFCAALLIERCHVSLIPICHRLPQLLLYRLGLCFRPPLLCKRCCGLPTLSTIACHSCCCTASRSASAWCGSSSGAACRRSALALLAPHSHCLPQLLLYCIALGSYAELLFERRHVLLIPLSHHVPQLLLYRILPCCCSAPLLLAMLRVTHPSQPLLLAAAAVAHRALLVLGTVLQVTWHVADPSHPSLAAAAAVPHRVVLLPSAALQAMLCVANPRSHRLPQLLVFVFFGLTPEIQRVLKTVLGKVGVSSI